MSAIRTIAISANGKNVEPLGGRYFAVISATGGFNVDFGDGLQIPMVAGRRYGPTDFSRLTFTDTSGAPNTVQFIVSFDEVQVSETTGGAVTATISAADVASIVAGRTTARTAAVVISTGSAAYSGKKYLEIHNTGAAALTIDGVSLAAGESVVFPLLQDGETYAAVTVNATGTTAKIVTVT